MQVAAGALAESAGVGSTDGAEYGLTILSDSNSLARSSGWQSGLKMRLASWRCANLTHGREISIEPLRGEVSFNHCYVWNVMLEQAVDSNERPRYIIRVVPVTPYSGLISGARSRGH